MKLQNRITFWQKFGIINMKLCQKKDKLLTFWWSLAWASGGLSICIERFKKNWQPPHHGLFYKGVSKLEMSMQNDSKKPAKFKKACLRELSKEKPRRQWGQVGHCSLVISPLLTMFRKLGPFRPTLKFALGLLSVAVCLLSLGRLKVTCLGFPLAPAKEPKNPNSINGQSDYISS